MITDEQRLLQHIVTIGSHLSRVGNAWWVRPQDKRTGATEVLHQAVMALIDSGYIAWVDDPAGDYLIPTAEGRRHCRARVNC